MPLSETRITGCPARLIATTWMTGTSSLRYLMEWCENAFGNFHIQVGDLARESASWHVGCEGFTTMSSQPSRRHGGPARPPGHPASGPTQVLTEAISRFPHGSHEGAFERQENAFRSTVCGPDDPPPEDGRYHLYVSLACPWAHRTLIARTLLGLGGRVGVSIADPIRDERGWAFREGPGHHGDEAEGFSYLMEAYHATDPDFHGRPTNPVLWDREEKKIVNNSEDDICRMFQQCFADPEGPDLFPAGLAGEQEELDLFLNLQLADAVYRAGFATDQAVYEGAVRNVFLALDEMAVRLAQSRFLLGEQLVESDLRLFCTLVRFDTVYHGLFKCNLRRIIDYPPLLRFMTDVYLHPGVSATVHFDHIKRHYYGSHQQLNLGGIIPLGPASVFAPPVCPPEEPPSPAMEGGSLRAAK